MSQNPNQVEAKIDLRPTLFIGIGGTGMEVLMRLRRRILNGLWGNSGSKTRVNSLAEFPIAQFIHLDLDNGAIIDSGRAQNEDLQFDLVKFSDDEKIIETFDMETYCKNDDELDRYPNIKAWLPLHPQKIRALGIDPSRGAGQIRSVSRLYFFDKYKTIREKIRLKLRTLQANLSHQEQLNKLGLTMETDRFRVVIVGSVAGGTGSGAFLDMGLLARALAKSEVDSDSVELMLFMPTGFANANKERTEANGYAALMELESAMRGNTSYQSRWDDYERMTLPNIPFSEAYLIDTANFASQATSDIKDIYHLVADTLFEDFASGDFARRKRSTAVNQAQHKLHSFTVPVPRERYGDMRLSYSKSYSAFGQAVLDTTLESRRDERAYRWAGEMLKAFFGVSGHDVFANQAIDKQRDSFIKEQMHLDNVPFNEIPTLSDSRFKNKFTPFNDYQIVDELLKDNNGSLLSGIEEKVNRIIDDVKNGFPRSEWAPRIRDIIQLLERDTVRDQDASADVAEDRIVRKRMQLLESIYIKIKDRLYNYLDNRDYGGLEYVLSLVEQIKDRLEAQSIGIIDSLRKNNQRYLEIKDAIRTSELERLFNNLEQVKGNSLFSNNEKQAVQIIDHLRTDIANSIKFYLRAKAASEAAILMQDLSKKLGEKQGVDSNGFSIWNGLVGELQEGRDAVLAMLKQLNRANDILKSELKREHATLIYIESNEIEPDLPNKQQMYEWAYEAFKEIGGSKVLFPMLVDNDDQKKILNTIKRVAERKLFNLSPNNNQTAEQLNDPLITALENMSPTQRANTFSRLLSRAMPWVDGNLGGEVRINSDQYKCFIGVANADIFRKKFEHEITAQIPTQAGITGQQVSIVETGNIGRAVCYCEISGIPLTILRGMSNWRTSYDRETTRDNAIPIHIHKDSSEFIHPAAPQMSELNQLADDFKYYLKGVMSGVIFPYKLAKGRYCFLQAQGHQMPIGNEKGIRQNGLPLNHSSRIRDQINDKFAAFSKNQLFALAALAKYYEDYVYTPKIVLNDRGVGDIQTGLACRMAAEIYQELHKELMQYGVDSMTIDAGIQRLLMDLNTWTIPLSDSELDGYIWEVQPSDDPANPRKKYQFKTQLSDAELEVLIAPPVPVAAAAAATATISNSPSPLVTPPPLMTPPPLTQYLYFLGIRGEQLGPFTAEGIVSTLTVHSIYFNEVKVWREGLNNWVFLNEFPELSYLFNTTNANLNKSPPPL